MGKREYKREHAKVKTRGWRDLLIALILVLCSIYLIACTMPKKGIIIKNIYVNHVNVSGLGQEEAALLIRKDFEKSYAYQALTVEAGGQRFSVMINKSLEIDANAAAEAACKYAHGPFLTRGAGVIYASIFKKRFSWNAHIADEEELRQAVRASGLTQVDTTRQTEYKIEGDQLIFTKGSVGESVDQPALLEMLTRAVQSEDYVSVIRSPMVTGTVEDTDMEEVYGKVHTLKRDASLNPKKNYKIVKSRRGIDFDVKSAQDAFDAAGEGERVYVPLDIDPPDVTTADLKKHLFKDLLGECTTRVEGSEGRKTNIAIAADEIDGKILLAGESFSFNKTLGERTEDKGYCMAYAYPEGYGESELGGGITQVSSTLYVSAMLSNLKIKERDNQKYVSNYIDKGMDADVKWKEQDFSFTNNTKYPVKIDADYEDGQLSIHLKGSRLNKNTVEISSEILEIYEHETVYTSDRSLTAGKNVVVSSGVDGYKVETCRNIYDKDHKLISSKKEARSTYDSIKGVIAEGTYQPKPKTKTEKDSESKKDQKEVKDSTGAEKGADQ